MAAATTTTTTTTITSPGIQIYFFYSLIWLISTLLLLSLITKHRRLIKSGAKHPPGPLVLPIIGHLHLLIRSSLHKSLRDLASIYGPLMTIRIGPSTFVVVSDAATAYQIFKTHDLHFSSRFSSAISDDSIQNNGRSFFAAEYGAYWRFVKKMCVTELLSASQINKFGEIRKQEMVNLLRLLWQRSDRGEACEVRALLTTMTNNVISRMAMSTRTSGNADESAEIGKLTKEIDELAPKLMLGALFGPLKNVDLFGYRRRFREVYGQYGALLERIMREHEDRQRDGNGAAAQRKDMIDILLEIYKDETAEARITKNDIRSITLDIFLGGTDTTSLALEWTLAELINHPDALKKLREEINTIVGPSRLVQESDVPNLPYLQAVVKESLRLHPPIPMVVRKCRENCNINGFGILSNTNTMVNAYAIMRDPEIWDDPTKFAPERFLGGGDCGDLRGQSFNFLAFGGGRRACPGAGLAVAVIHVTIAAMVQCFEWGVSRGRTKEEEVVNMDEKSGFALRMAHPLVCFPVARLHPLEVGIPSSN